LLYKRLASGKEVGKELKCTFLPARAAIPLHWRNIAMSRHQPAMHAGSIAGKNEINRLSAAESIVSRQCNVARRERLRVWVPIENRRERAG
jgi:hypothetical protein